MATLTLVPARLLPQALARFLLVLVLAALALVPVRAQTVTAFPELTGRIVDEAGLMDSRASALEARLAAFEQETGHQLVVVTVKTLGGRDIAGYARDLGNHWGIGQAGRDNGILLLVALQERTVRIVVGRGLEGRMPNQRAAAIIDSAILPAFRDKRPADGIIAGADAIIADLQPLSVTLPE